MLPSRFLPSVLAAIAVSVCACGSDDGGGSGKLPIAVLSAFPAEQLPLVERATVVETRSIGGFTFRFGRLGGVPVVLGMTGIGLLNAGATTRALLDQVEVGGVVVSAVAGSPLFIGDVAVPEAWSLANGATYSVDARWLEMAHELGASAKVALENCTARPNAPSDPPICLPHQPRIVTGGVGQSADSFGTTPFACIPNGGDVFGCDVVLPAAVSGLAGDEGMKGAAGGTEEFAAVDMETAAIAREAAAAGVPFIAFRSVSDGEGDPLGLPGFPAQFFTYYRLAARNAAAATIAFLEHL